MARAVLKDSLKKASELAMQLRRANNETSALGLSIATSKCGSSKGNHDEEQYINEQEFVNLTSQLMQNFTCDNLQVELPPLHGFGCINAPVFYASIYESDLIHACIFGFYRKGSDIPLHNHPGMHGFVKVIRGSAQVTSFSRLSAAEERSERRKHLLCGFQGQPVRYEGTQIRTFEDECLHLSPTKGNIHRVVGLEDGAAFFDLLVPGYGDRPCTFYDVVPRDPAKSADGICFVKEIPIPNFYFCETIPYNEIHEL
ncbi:hypothetical protein AB6A40_010610 [Gnathostoma spinigerum]|uniref:2-aminoethanethiol dioxygenase n=1 Tax=Gnathostoma spinigerum TaxID=75299 RepID=A0ABD6EVI4_9BILA